MSVPRRKAEMLLSTSEMRLYESSRRGVVDVQGSPRLDKLIAATRKHLDKYRDRALSQKRDARGKGRLSPSRAPERKAKVPSAAANTATKVEIFTDILARFEAARARAEARADTTDGKSRPKATKAAPKKAAPKKAAPKKAAPKKAAPKKAAPKKAAPKRASPSKRSLSRAATEKAAVRANAAAESAPIAEKRPRKKVAAVKTKHLAQGAARGRRRQAKRDAR